MLLQIPDVLTPEQVTYFQSTLAAQTWLDGALTAGYQSAQTKHNLQLEEGCDAARELGRIIEEALGSNPLFVSAALPAKVYPPLFNKYEGGGQFGPHIDNAVRQLRGTAFRVRSDLSATVFLCDPDDYDGGELVIEGTYGTQKVKLKAGDMVLYPATSLHHVTPVTRGARLASFFWIQSMVREAEARETLFQMDTAIQALAAENGALHPAVVKLTGVYHNLLRRWIEA
jgi:PKHD-type hydroxylase